METIIFHMKESAFFQDELVGNLLEQGYLVSFQLPDRLESPEGILIITDDNGVARSAGKNGIACIGFEDRDRKDVLSPIRDVQMVLQSFDGIDAKFLEQMYCRCRGIAWTIRRTEQIFIRESVMEDFDAIYEMCQNPSVCKYMPGMGKCREEERELFRSYIQNCYPFFGYGMWTVLESSTGQLIGRAGLEHRTYRGNTVLEAGYMIGPDWQRKGYGTAVLKEIRDFAAENLEEKTLYAFIHPKNLPSIKTAVKAGFWRAEEGVYLYTFTKHESTNILK